MKEKELTKGMNYNSKPVQKTAGLNVRKVRNKRQDLIEDLKMEIATELGIMEQINSRGWDSLSPKDSGRIGGKLSQRLKKIGR